MVIEKAFAKINLALYVGNNRPDGYHEIDTIMMPVSLWDTITITKSNDISIICDNPLIPTDYRNIAYIAAEEFLKAANIIEGVKIKIAKTIPAGGGLGGGSADAAAVLRGLNKMHGNFFNNTELAEIAVKIGADVPFLITNKTAVCRGIGEILDPINTSLKLHFCICFKSGGSNTKIMYSKLDDTIRQYKNTENMRKALESNNVNEVCNSIYNDFTEICEKLLPETKILYDELMLCGAKTACISGSGASVFGVFNTKEQARKAEKTIGRHSFAKYARSL